MLEIEALGTGEVQGGIRASFPTSSKGQGRGHAGSHPHGVDDCDRNNNEW